MTETYPQPESLIPGERLTPELAKKALHDIAAAQRVTDVVLGNHVLNFGPEDQGNDMAASVAPLLDAYTPSGCLFIITQTTQEGPWYIVFGGHGSEFCTGDQVDARVNNWIIQGANSMLETLQSPYRLPEFDLAE